MKGKIKKMASIGRNVWWENAAADQFTLATQGTGTDPVWPNEFLNQNTQQFLRLLVKGFTVSFYFQPHTKKL